MAKRIILEPIAQETSVKTNDNLLSMLLKHKLNVQWKCRGRGRCSTCHVYIQEGVESLSPKSRRELKTLALISSCEENSRLA
ncbi:2Fe-2S iron-sulfur cluster-binding protein, partial [Acaryochloris marina NIES-2412]|uniref:2Fe-2S iron-sulfur cluster-binding protein n=1 Tax=Acaryochloris marina TaxID=155978 RepID=UPI0040588D93